MATGTGAAASVHWAVIMRAQRLGSVFVLGFLLHFHPALSAGDDPLIQTVQIRGTRRPLELETCAGQRFDADRIDRDVRRLWATGWFDNITVESSESARGTQLIFTVTERPRLYLRRIEFEPARERRSLKLQKGVRVDAVLARQVAGELRRQLVEDGYAGASVEAELSPVGLRQADLRLRVERGPVYRVGEVHFSRPSGLRPKEVSAALRASRPRRLLPGLGPLWHGWRLLEPLSDSRVQDSAVRLRSLYFSRGYFDAQVEIGAVKITDRKATVTLNVDSGRRYGVRRMEMAGAGPAKQIPARPNGALFARGLCQCLLEARLGSERRGDLDFSAQLQLKAPAAPAPAIDRIESAGENLPPRQADTNLWIDLTAKINSGPTYRIGRIEFSGHHAVSDTTLRRALLLREGDVFDQERLRRSLARLNRFAFLEPLAVSDIRTKPAPDHLVNLRIAMREKPRGRWSLSGPLGPLSFFGAPQFAIGTRLPSRQVPMELSTYYASFSLLASAWPWADHSTRAPRIRWQPLVALERPYMPGQRWQSGFVLSPQLGWRGTLASYGLRQAVQAAQSLLGQDSLRPAGMSVPAWWYTLAPEDERTNVPPNGVLLCEERKPAWAQLEAAGSRAAGVVTRWLGPAALARLMP